MAIKINLEKENKIEIAFKANTENAAKITTAINSVIKNCSAAEMEILGKLVENSTVKAMAIEAAKQYI
jgi:stage V sporulation protein SpoVS